MEEEPGVKLTGRVERGVRYVLGARTDIALIDDLSITVGDKKESFGVVPIAKDVLSVALGARHPLGERLSLSVADLTQDSWAIDSTLASGYSVSIVPAFRRCGRLPVSLGSR